MNQWYFAYGSNLWLDQMVQRIGPVSQGEDRPRVARLPDYRLLFNMKGDSRRVYANIESPGAGVLGVIYRCGAEACRKLDEFEEGYDRLPVDVVTEDGETLPAFAYVAKPANRASGGKPSAEYLRRIVTGARQHGLPEAYIREIEAVATGNAS